MFPLKVDPGWYGDHWYSARPRKQRKVLSASLGRFAVLVLLLAGSGAVLSTSTIRAMQAAIRTGNRNEPRPMPAIIGRP